MRYRLKYKLEITCLDEHSKDKNVINDKQHKNSMSQCETLVSSGSIEKIKNEVCEKIEKTCNIFREIYYGGEEN